MKTGTFIAEVEGEGKLSIPEEIRDRLNLSNGDKIEMSKTKNLIFDKLVSVKIYAEMVSETMHVV